jgi:hypothetical protein
MATSMVFTATSAPTCASSAVPAPSATTAISAPSSFTETQAMRSWQGLRNFSCAVPVTCPAA